MTTLSDNAPALPSRSMTTAVAGWLHEHQNAPRTHDDYQDLIQKFLDFLAAEGGMELSSPPLMLVDAIQVWLTRSTNPNRTKPLSPATIMKRRAALGSFFEYAVRRGYVKDNPMRLLGKGPRVQPYAKAVPLATLDVKARMAAIERSTHIGKRDYALLSIALTTGRRLTELQQVRWEDLAISSDDITITFHAKGDKIISDTLKPAISKALFTYLHATFGDDLALPPIQPIWLSFSTQNYRAPLGKAGVADICERYLGTAKVHTLRHTFSRHYLKAGGSIVELAERLGHDNIATTSTYAKSLSIAENKYGDALVEMFGLE